jgi:hypothetical protein
MATGRRAERPGAHRIPLTGRLTTANNVTTKSGHDSWRPTRRVTRPLLGFVLAGLLESALPCCSDGVGDRITAAEAMQHMLRE